MWEQAIAASGCRASRSAIAEPGGADGAFRLAHGHSYSSGTGQQPSLVSHRFTKSKIKLVIFVGFAGVLRRSLSTERLTKPSE